MKRKSILLMALACAASLFAADPYATALTTIIENNPEMRSRQLLIEAQACDYADANSLANPTVEYGYLNGDGLKWSLSVTQEFEWPGVYRLRSRASEYGITSAQMQALADNLDLALEAKQLLIDMVYLRRQLDISKKTAEALSVMGEAIDSSLSKGHVTILDSKKQQFELYKARTACAELESKIVQTEERLQAMAGGAMVPTSGITDYPLEPSLTAEQYAELFASLDPVLASQGMERDQAQAQAQAARLSRLPSFTVGYNHEYEMGEKFDGFTVGMTLPFFQNRKSRKAALLRQEAADLSAQQRTAEAKSEIESLMTRMDVWRKQMDAYETTLNPAQYLELLGMSLRAGQISVIEYLYEMQYIYEAASRHCEVQYNYHSAAAALNKYALLDLLQK